MNLNDPLGWSHVENEFIGECMCIDIKEIVA